MTQAPVADHTVQEADDDHHATAGDPNAAPLRQQVRSDFSLGQLLYVWILGAIALVGGLVAGLILVNK